MARPSSKNKEVSPITAETQPNHTLNTTPSPSPALTPDPSSVPPATASSLSTVTKSNNNIDDLVNAAVTNTEVVKTRKAKDVTPEQFNSVIQDMTKLGLTNTQATVSAFGLLQIGGTNKGKRSNVKLTLGNDITIESKTLQRIIAQHCPGVTPRQFARQYANQIFRVAKHYKFDGSAWISLDRLYNNMLDINNPEYSDYRYWATEFQVDNPDCPEEVRAALRKRFSDRFMKK